MENKFIFKSKYQIIHKNTNSRQRLSGIVFLRSCCSLGIIIYHYFCHSNGKFKLLYKTANSDWGFMFVTSFFCISGAVHYYNYRTVNSLKIFYFKRWKSIFPSYYLCFIYFYSKNVFQYKKLFFRGHWSRLILTIFGLDGYLRRIFKTYNLIGEWFVGSIIIIYFLYPLLSWLININILIINYIICVYYFFNYYTNNLKNLGKRNIFNCINSFYFGMITIKFHKLFFKNKKFFIISFIIFVLFYFIRISLIVPLFQIQGFSLYIILIYIGEYIMMYKIKYIF